MDFISVLLILLKSYKMDVELMKRRSICSVRMNDNMDITHTQYDFIVEKKKSTTFCEHLDRC